MACELAKFVAWVALQAVRQETFISEVKGLTFVHYPGFAVLALENGGRALVRGGRTGV